MHLWHRYLGIVLGDYYSDGPVEVILEKDLSQRQKFLDILLLLAGQIPWAAETCPVGLEPANIRPHNLISFKSHQDLLNSAAVEHLIACLSDYRYQAQAEKRAELDPDAAKKEPKLLPNDQIRAIAVTARYPEALAAELGERWRETGTLGVYQMDWGTRTIDIIVCRRVEVVERNSLWLLFSGDQDKVAFGMRHYGLKQSDLSTILNEIHEITNLEGLNMPYTVEDYKKEASEREAIRQSYRIEGASRIVVRLLMKKLGIAPEESLPIIKNLDCQRLELLAEAVLDFESVEDLRKWVSKDQAGNAEAGA